MKALSITGLVLGILGLLVGLYVQFIIAPAVASLEHDESELGMMLWVEARSAQTNTGMIALFLGGLGVLTAIWPAIKTKKMLSFIAIIISLIAFFLGAANGTHMFS